MIALVIMTLVSIITGIGFEEGYMVKDEYYDDRVI